MVYALRWFAREAGLRFLARRKAAFTVAVLTMALALGANTVVFSALKTFLFSSIGVPDADRLFFISPTRGLPGARQRSLSRSLSQLRAHSSHAARLRRRGIGVPRASRVGIWASEARPLKMARVTASFFPTMRVFPTLGRAFEQRRAGAGRARLVVISYGALEIRDGGRPRRSRQNDAARRRAVHRDRRDAGRIHATGARPTSGFRSTFRLSDPSGDHRRAPLPPVWSSRGRADASRRRARREGLHQAHGRGERRQPRVPVRGAADSTRSSSAGADSTVLLVQEGAAVLLLLAVLNLASLLLAWGFERQQEIAVRQALGAGGARVIRILLLQSLFVVGTGAVIGVGVTRLAVPWLRGLELPALAYFTSRISLDGGVLAVSAAVAVIAGLIAGVLPAWFSRRIDLAQALRSGARSTTLSPAALRWQQGMVVVQAALSVVILAAAVLVGVSFRNLQRVPGGFSAKGAIVARVQVDPERYPDPAVARGHGSSARRQPRRASRRSLPPAFSSTLPVSDEAWSTYFFITMPDGSLSKEPLLFQIRRTSPNYLQTIGIPLLTGRQFDGHDDANSPPVAIVSRALADRLWPGETAIGKRIYRSRAREQGAGSPHRRRRCRQRAGRGGERAAGRDGVRPVGAAVDTYAVPRREAARERRRRDQRRATRAAGSPIRFWSPTTSRQLDALVDQANALPRLQSIILLTFAVAAIVMAMLGCYGVMRQLVATREREYAMRLVFGASPAELGRSVLRQVARLTVPGVVVGLLAVDPSRRHAQAIRVWRGPAVGGGPLGGEPGDARDRGRGRAALGGARDARGRAAQHHPVRSRDAGRGADARQQSGRSQHRRLAPEG